MSQSQIPNHGCFSIQRTCVLVETGVTRFSVSVGGANMNINGFPDMRLELGVCDTANFSIDPIPSKYRASIDTDTCHFKKNIHLNDQQQLKKN